MIIENLETEHIVRVANLWAIDNWKRVHPDHKWDGYDLVGDKYIFQLSYEGTIRIFHLDGLHPVNLDIQEEDCLRELLNNILRKNGK